MNAMPQSGLQMLTLVKESGELEISLADSPVTPPRDHEVTVRVLAAPINPSDLGLLVGAGDVATAQAGSRDGRPLLTAAIPEQGMRAMAGRIGQALPIGNEGSGTVIAAGTSAAAQALLGKTVAMIGGAMYAQYRTLPAQACMALPDGTDPRDGASCFVNPLTALGFVETMRREGHSAIVHTAAASNLGQMLVRICAKDGVPLINIVRSTAQAELLMGIGATHVIDSSSDGFMAGLVDAIAETGATIGFDAIGGGKLAGQILGAMEQAAVRRMKDYSRYGSDAFKQVYIYGALDLGPTILNRSFGLSWSLGGWLLTPFLGKIGAEGAQALRDRVVAELTTTFASHYSHEISLGQALDPETLKAYNAKRTGEKYLIRPNG